MKSKVAEYIDSLIFLILLVVGFLTPLFFIDITTDFYGIPKLILLVTTTLIIYGLWSATWLLKGKINIKRTPLDIPLSVTLAVVLLSTLFGSSRYISIFGAFPEVHGSAVSWVTYILLYFAAASNIKDKNLGRVFLQTLIGAASVLALIGIFSFFGVFLPFEIAKSINFTPTGSTFSTAALLLMLLPLTLIATVKPSKLLPRPLAMIISLVFSLALVLIGSMGIYIIFFLIFFTSIYLVKDHFDSTALPMLLTPFALSVMTLMLVLIPFSGNKLNESKFNFPKELKLPLDTAWEISISTFADRPVFGTGPSTFVYNFTKYKPREFNNLDYWNFKFGSAGNEPLQVLSALGIAGFLSFGLLYAVIFLQSKRNLNSSSVNNGDKDLEVILPGLALSGMVMVLIIFIHSSTLITVIYTLFVMAVYFSYQGLTDGKGKDFSIAVKIPQKQGKSLDLLSPAAFVITAVLVFLVGGRVYKAAAADYYHRLALNQAERDGSKTYEYLQKAEELNPYIDLYRIDMAQTNLALANALVSQKGPTTQNSEGSLTDEDRQTIQTLIAQAINEAKAATALAPRSSRNWEVLALIYRNISGVAENSLAFALDAYGRAIENDPLNPSLRVGVGTVYYSVENYDEAVRFFRDSINLKPDYVKGYYNLALALREKGDLKEARLVAEQVVSFIRERLTSEEQEKATELLQQAWVRDYSAATQLLSQIEDKIETEGSREAGGLIDPSLPELDVPGLENPPEIITPDSIEETQDLDINQIESVNALTPTPF